MSVPKQPFKGIKEIPYPSHDMIQRWSSRDRAGEIRLLNETGKWEFDPPLNINDLEGDFQTEELVKYNDLNTEEFNVNPNTNEVTLAIDYITLTDFSGADYIQPDPLPAAAILLSASTVSTIEGGSVTVEVSLQREPTDDVVLGITSLDTDVATVTQSSLTFTTANYDTPQTIEINGITDLNASLDTTSIRISVSSSADNNYTNLTSKYITVNVDDLDTADFTVSKTSMNIDEGTSSSFTVRLTTEPQADVEVRITPADTNVATVDTSSIVFTDTNWDTPVTVVVTAVEDSETEDQTTTINVQVYQSLDPDYNSLSDKTINITSINNDSTSPSEIQIGNTIWKTSTEVWDDGGSGIYYPDGDVNNVDDYGLLYDFDAVERLLAANPGYRLPNYEDVRQLILSYDSGNTWYYNNVSMNLDSTDPDEIKTFPNNDIADNLGDNNSRGTGFETYIANTLGINYSGAARNLTGTDEYTNFGNKALVWNINTVNYVGTTGSGAFSTLFGHMTLQSGFLIAGEFSAFDALSVVLVKDI